MTKRGFTLIELLIVVAIIGIIAAIAIPNLLVAIQKSKQKATIADMRTLATSIEIYVTDNCQAPSDMTFGNNGDFYIKNFPEVDAWGNSWLYARDNSMTQLYSIVSPGKDNVFGGYDQSGIYIVNSLQDFNKDIIFSRGLLAYGPSIK